MSQFSEAQRAEQSSIAIDFFDSLQESQRLANEAAEHGRIALTTLQQQKELLDQTEDTLEASEYVLQSSMRVLRGMTWRGWVYNMFNNDAKPETVSLATAVAVNESFKNSSTAKSNSTKPELFRESNRSSETMKSGLGDKVDEQLSDIARTVAELHDMSLVISDQLDGHNEALERIDQKSEIVHDKMLAATLKASQISQRSKHSGYHFLGLFQFADTESGNFLSVDIDENITLSNIPSKATFFNCYCKEGNLIGLQNVKTLTFIGSTWLSSIKASGRVFGKQEECFINLRDGQLTGIFILAINWGNGGWLRRPYEVESGIRISSVTSSVTDKAGALILRTILISETELRGDTDVDD